MVYVLKIVSAGVQSFFTLGRESYRLVRQIGGKTLWLVVQTFHRMYLMLFSFKILYRIVI